MVMPDLIPDEEQADLIDVIFQHDYIDEDAAVSMRDAERLSAELIAAGFRRVSPVTREALIEAMKAVDSLTVGNKSCSRDGCNHWAGYQDSGSTDWCACHYGADTSECDGRPEPSLPRVERYADAIMSLFPVSPPAEVEWEYGEFRKDDIQEDGSIHPWAEPLDTWETPLTGDELADLADVGSVCARRVKACPWVPVKGTEQ